MARLRPRKDPFSGYIFVYNLYCIVVPNCVSLDCLQESPYMAYEVFERSNARVGTPAVAIVPDGRIAINAAAVRIAKDQRINWVLLLWDWTHHRLAIKASQKGEKNAYALSMSEGRSGSIRAKSFVSFIGWKARKRVPIPASWNEKERMFEVVLPAEHLESERWGVQRSKSQEH